MSRHWSPCRVCRAEHRNPMSSSLCTTCGIVQQQKNAAEQETRDNRLDLLDMCESVDDLKNVIRLYLLN